MSFEYLYPEGQNIPVINCDIQGTSCDVHWAGFQGATEEQCREDAHNAGGWTYVDGQDICPADL